MKTIEEEEKKDKVIAFSVAVGVGIVLFLICAFTIVWTPPDPPLPQYGLEVDFGFEELPVDEEITDSKPQETSAAENPITENEPIITETEETENEEAESENEELEETEDFQEITESEDFEETEIEDANEELETEDFEEDVITNPPVKKKTAVVPKKIIVNPVATPQNKRSINMNDFFDDDDEKEIIDNTQKNGNGNNETATTNITSSLKEKGQPLLNISGGWQWVNIPNAKDPSDETGFVKIGFWVGRDGIVEHTEVVKATATLSPSTKQFYENQMKGRKFHREGNRYQQHAKSDYGTVTFYLVKE